jgi:COP9 signalosome complex subunit 6
LSPKKGLSPAISYLPAFHTALHAEPHHTPASLAIAHGDDPAFLAIMAHAAIHPLVLLTISDYITRHTLRELKQPIVGVLLGQQNGREVTIEHAYDVRLIPQSADASESSSWKLHETFFKDRLQQYKDVHKDPPLELMGWWTLAPRSGPPQEIMGIHRYIMENYNESALLLAFHPDAVKQSDASGGSAPGVKLPLTIYESVYESNKSEGDADKMQVEGEAATGESLQLRLREMPYDIATGEAEMIGVDFVARGGGNATAINDQFASAHGSKEASGKGKEVVNGHPSDKKRSDTQSSFLSPEEEERRFFATMLVIDTDLF